MSQASVYNLLKKSNKPMTAIEIIKKLNLSKSSISTSTSKLLRQGELSSIKRENLIYYIISKEKLQQKQYISTCTRCLPRTEIKPHRIHCIKSRGAKLQCLKCGHIKQRYTKLHDLQEMKK